MAAGSINTCIEVHRGTCYLHVQPALSITTPPSGRFIAILSCRYTKALACGYHFQQATASYHNLLLNDREPAPSLPPCVAAPLIARVSHGHLRENTTNHSKTRSRSPQTTDNPLKNKTLPPASIHAQGKKLEGSTFMDRRRSNVARQIISHGVWLVGVGYPWDLKHGCSDSKS